MPTTTTGKPATDQVAQVPTESLVVIFFAFLLYLIACGGVIVIFHKFKIKEPTTDDGLIAKVTKSKQFWLRFLFVVIAAMIGTLRIEHTCGRGEPINSCDNWHMMFWYGLLLTVTASVSTAPFEFYLGEGVSFWDNVKFWVRNTPIPTQEDYEEASRQRWVEGSDAQTGNVGFKTLMPSVFISWIFAKSIRNSAWLGGRYGPLGGIAYTSWYLSFFTTGVVCYLLRTRYNFKSLPTAVYKNYGVCAVILFQLCLFFRLFNEVWSNAGVIGGFYGPKESPGYWGAAWLSVLIPVGYVMLGGMRASLFSDVFQAGLALLFLVVVLSAIGSDQTFSSRTNGFAYEPSTIYKATGGWDGGWWACFVAGSVQGIISYPFFDPVLTDRGFIGTPKTMLMSMFIGGGLAAAFIFFFSFIGVYGAFAREHFNKECNCNSGQIGLNPTSECPSSWNPCASLASSTVSEASDVAVILGHQTFRALEVFVNFIMITASMSTLDSTFTSASKLVSLEFCGFLNLEGDSRDVSAPLRPQDLNNIGPVHIRIARITMACLGLIGTAFLGIEGDVMQATTAAGTCVMGIGAPIWFMTVWKVKTEGSRGWRQSPLAFVVPTLVGFVFGLSYWANGRKDVKSGWTYDWALGSSDKQDTFYYSRFLGVNVYGHLICGGLFFLFFALHQILPKMGVEYFPEVEPEIDQQTDKETKELTRV